MVLTPQNSECAGLRRKTLRERILDARMFYVLTETATARHPPMLAPCFPPEITDSIVDLLHDKPGALEQCCLVCKSWVPRARKHLFSRIEFRLPADVDAWKEIFPDPANSLGCYAHSLSIECVEALTIADTEEGSWVQAFSNVVRLRVANSGMRNIPSRPFLRLLNSFE
jgi:hypothetical protein